MTYFLPFPADPDDGRSEGAAAVPAEHLLSFDQLTPLRPADDFEPCSVVADMVGGGEQMVAAVTRICQRLADTARPQVAVLKRGGVRVDLGDDLGERRRWVVCHKLLRELSLVGWHVTVDEARLLVLGWSAAQLEHRLRVLQLALGSLQQVAGTIGVAVAYAEQHQEQFPHCVREEAIASVLDRLQREHLRWPVRLAELDGLPRISRHHTMQRQLRASVMLEERLRTACAWHVQVAGLAIEAMWRGLTEQGLRGESARGAAIERLRNTLLPDQPPRAAGPAAPGIL
ncbi:hypothetical protein [Nonomuraea sp. NPDC049695]|uniref:hypothetical protein n=1 Tax=Nonomuraea sp. NPDC049695 TaxID=3154734 RepID=UPI00343416DD